MSEVFAIDRCLQRVALGDRSAFEQLYRQTAAKLYGVSYTILRRQDLAEEALQDAYVKVWHRAGEYAPDKGSVMSWLISIVRYRAIDLLRKKANQELHDDDMDSFSRDDHTEELIDRAISEKKLNECLHELQPNTRQCIQLAFIFGLSHQEVSEHVKEALGTVKSWIRRGMESLKGCLQR